MIFEINTNYASGFCQSSIEPGKYVWVGEGSEMVSMPRNRLAGNPYFSDGYNYVSRFRNFCENCVLLRAGVSR